MNTNSSVSDRDTPLTVLAVTGNISGSLFCKKISVFFFQWKNELIHNSNKTYKGSDKRSTKRDFQNNKEPLESYPKEKTQKFNMEIKLRVRGDKVMNCFRFHSVVENTSLVFSFQTAALNIYHFKCCFCNGYQK